MAKRINSETPESLLKKLASSSPNDAVKLLFLDEEDISAVEGLDLSLLAEVKRSPSGTVELKFVDKLAVLRELNTMEKAAEAVVTEYGPETVCVSFPHAGGDSIPTDELKQRIEQILPCHLDIVYEEVYITWKQFNHENFTWKRLEYEELTWYRLQNYEVE